MKADWRPVDFAGVVTIGFLCTAIAYSLWGVLLKYNPISKVTVFGFFNPIAGVILSALLLQEKQDMGLGTLIALILVSCGIYLVNRDSDKKKKK